MGKHTGQSPDVVDLLKRQHRQIRRLFRQAALPGPARKDAFDELRRMLAVHEAAEEAHVHPVTKKVVKGGKKLVSARLEEEKSAKKLLRQLEKTGTDTKGYLPLLMKLRAAVLAHAKLEEREEFPLLRKAVTDVRRRSLRLESKLTQALAPTHPHPMVNTQLANKMAAPLAGPLDRSRDVLHRLIRR